jgi:hypothetical protein
MIQLRKKISFITFTDYWFDYSFSWKNIFMPVCWRSIWNKNTAVKFGVKKNSSTIILSLEKTEQEIFNGYSEDTKKAVKRAAGVQCKFHNNPVEFISFYNAFATAKGLPGFSKKDIGYFGGPDWVYCNAIQEGEVLVAHSYIMDREKGIVRAMYGGSVRLDEKHLPKKIGNATKLLYHDNILHFKGKGFKHYDFGGWNEVPGLLSFKLSFGPEIKETTNIFSYAYFFKDMLGNFVKKIKKH